MLSSYLWMQRSQAWKHCGNLYQAQVDDKAATTVVRTMTSLVNIYPSALAACHLELLQHVLAHDPRKFVRNFALLSACDLVGDGTSDELAAGLFTCGIQQLRVPRGFLRLKLSALQLLQRLLSSGHDFGDKTAEVLSLSKALFQTTTDTRFTLVHGQILASVCAQTLRRQNGTTLDLTLLDDLLGMLHPSLFNKSSHGWQETLATVVRVCGEFSSTIAVIDQAVLRFLELIELLPGSDANNATAREWIVTALAHLPSPSVDVICDTVSVLLKEFASARESRQLKSLAQTSLKWKAQLVLANSGQQIGESLEQALLSAPYDSHADRYNVAKLAMLLGSMGLAHKLLGVITGQVDHECFGGWIVALHRLSKAEDLVTSCGSVTMDSIKHAVGASTYLKLAATSSFRFDFQKQLVALRSEWMQLMLQAQQLAGEIAFTGTVDGIRERALSSRFTGLGDKYVTLQRKLAGADQTDLESIGANAATCALIVMSIDGLLLHQNPATIASAHLLPSHQAVATTALRLEQALVAKIERLTRLPSERQDAAGGELLVQFLKSICLVPTGLPRLFFRMRVRQAQRVVSSAQFLTYAENAAFTAKPRSRSQLGVPFGTDFTCLLKGVVALSTEALPSWMRSTVAVATEVLVCFGDDQGASDVNVAVHHRISAQLPAVWPLATGVKTASEVYLPFETAVHVQAEHLKVKGAFSLVAKVSLVDRSGALWPLAASGCRRGFIVY